MLQKCLILQGKNVSSFKIKCYIKCLKYFNQDNQKEESMLQINQRNWMNSWVELQGCKGSSFLQLAAASHCHGNTFQFHLNPVVIRAQSPVYSLPVKANILQCLLCELSLCSNLFDLVCAASRGLEPLSREPDLSSALFQLALKAKMFTDLQRIKEDPP